MKTNQSGIGSNVVNFGILIDRISTYGEKYNPVRNEFMIQYLKDLKTTAGTVLVNANNSENLEKKATALRVVAFEPINRLVTRAMNAFRISGASEPTVQQAETLVREFRGIRASKKPTLELIAAAKEEGKELRINRQHNTTFEKKIENFEKVVNFLTIQSEYGPNETDITIDALNAKLTELKTTNSECIKTSADYNAIRIERDTVLFADHTGLVDVAKGVKLYVKSAFGTSSPQYKSISDLRFIKGKSFISQPTTESPVVVR